MKIFAKKIWQLCKLVKFPQHINCSNFTLIFSQQVANTNGNCNLESPKTLQDICENNQDLNEVETKEVINEVINNGDDENSKDKQQSLDIHTGT